MAIRTRIVKVGNSRGVRIPKPLLELTGLAGVEEVEVHAEGDHLIIRPATSARAGWCERFKEVAAHGGDRLLDAEAAALSTWDREEWEW